MRTDAELLELCKKGNNAAYEELIKRYGAVIYSICVKFGFSEWDCNDTFNEVWLIFIKNLPRIQSESVKAWLAKVTENECKNLLRKNKKLTSLSDENGSQESEFITALPDETIAKIQTANLLRIALNKLSKKCQKLIRLLFYEKLSWKDSAEKLKIPQGSLGPTRKRCLEKMRSIFEKMGLGEFSDFF